MFKFVGGVVIGVFFGALALEVIARTRPGVLEKVEEVARRKAQSVSDFMGGSFEESAESQS